MARIQENALKKNPRLRILDIRIANSQPKIINQKMSPSYRIPSIQVPIFGEEELPAFFLHYKISRAILLSTDYGAKAKVSEYVPIPQFSNHTWQPISAQNMWVLLG